MNESEKQFSFTRATSSTSGRAKSKFLMMTKSRTIRGLVTALFAILGYGVGRTHAGEVIGASVGLCIGVLIAHFPWSELRRACRSGGEPPDVIKEGTSFYVPADRPEDEGRDFFDHMP